MHERSVSRGDAVLPAGSSCIPQNEGPRQTARSRREDQERARKTRSQPVRPGAHEVKRCANCVEAKYQQASHFTVPYQTPPTHHSEQSVVGKCVFKHGSSY